MNYYEFFLGKNVSVESAIAEQKDLYKERLPYTVVDTISGPCIVFVDGFIELCLEAMATNNLEQMTDEEQKIWYDFVGFSDSVSWSADDGITNAVGASNTQEDGLGYVIDSNGLTQTVASQPQYGYPNQAVSFALDQEFMRLLNCDDSTACGIKSGELYNVLPCN